MKSTVSRRAITVLSFTVYLLGVAGAVIAYNLNEAPVWVGGALAVAAVAGLCVFVGSIVQSVGRAETTELDGAVTQASMTTCVVVAVAGLSWSLLEAFAGAPRLTGAWASAAIIGTFVLCWNYFRGDGT